MKQKKVNASLIIRKGKCSITLVLDRDQMPNFTPRTEKALKRVVKHILADAGACIGNAIYLVPKTREPLAIIAKAIEQAAKEISLIVQKSS